MAANDEATRAAAKAECLDAALWGGIRGATIGLACSVPAVYLANAKFLTIRRLTVSAKTALVVSPFFLGFFRHRRIDASAFSQITQVTLGPSPMRCPFVS